uniref:Uncharacterized protein n=1 Tax=Peronospora matthiolae TaxID=2874970 RepID=A0AAV1TVW0_9STRA
MHVVMLANEAGTGECGDYVLVQGAANLLVVVLDLTKPMTAPLLGMDSTKSVYWRPPLLAVTKQSDVDEASVVLRNTILNVCSSPEEMAKYAMGFQEDLEALQSLNQKGVRTAALGGSSASTLVDQSGPRRNKLRICCNDARPNTL